MSLRERIENRGLKIKYVANKINVNYNSLRVYLNNPTLMPLEVETKLKDFLV